MPDKQSGTDSPIALFRFTPGQNQSLFKNPSGKPKKQTNPTKKISPFCHKFLDNSGRSYIIIAVCAGAGTGRQAWLRAMWRKPWGFDSPPAHKKSEEKLPIFFILIISLLYVSTPSRTGSPCGETHARIRMKLPSVYIRSPIRHTQLRPPRGLPVRRSAQ